MADDDEVEVSSSLMLVGLVVVATISFWFQATITEERFVPALNVIANALNIPDDIAGATIMAAGASSPELFAALVSIFITHSSLGMGTIVGSEVFNQTFICAGAIMAARKNRLKLDPVVVMREALFYTLAIICFLISLSDRGEVEEDDVEHVFITLYHGILLVGCYCLYVIVCANFESILQLLRGVSDIEFDSNRSVIETYGDDQSIQTETDMKNFPFVRSFLHEPAGNFQHTFTIDSKEDVITSNDEGSNDGLQTAGSIVTEFYCFDPQQADILQEEMMNPELYLVDRYQPSFRQMQSFESNEGEGSTKLFLWQRSRFYDKTRMDVNSWHLRWFTFYYDHFESVPHRRKSSDKHRKIYPPFISLEVDEAHLLIKVRTEEGLEDYILLAPSKRILTMAVDRLKRILHVPPIGSADTGDTSILTTEEKYLPGAHVSLIAFPYDESIIVKAVHVILFPFKLIIHYVVPDVRKCDPSLVTRKATIVTILCIALLIMGSYAMVTSLEHTASILQIPDAVVGATISAAGTSLPNYVASQIAARQGLGNMAISNVLGSNTFNILIGLGLPWLIYTAMNEGQYNEIRDEGITESLIAMVVAHVVFCLVLIQSRFELQLWHAYLFMFIYFLYVLFSIIDSYI